MTKSDIQTLPKYFDRYIHQVPDIELLEAMNQFGSGYMLASEEQMNRLGHQIYAPGKWTIHDIIQHIIDAERIFVYRALRFARKDNTKLPGFDENLFAASASASRRSLDGLLEEFAAVRNATICMFRSFDDEELMSTGISSNAEISVLALGFTLTGHVIHHMNVIQERYLPLISQ